MLTHNQTASHYAPDSHYAHFIDNQWVEGESGETIDSFNPANGAFLTKIPRGTAGDVDRAVQAAARAFKTWGKTSPAEDEVVALANASDYGLAGAVWTQDINRAIRVARAIETGRMWVNTYHDIPAHAPFGGYKKSGLGRETHKSMLDAYSEKKNIYISLNEAPFGVF